MNKKTIVFTPLRVALMLSLVVVNLMALVSFLNPDEAWSEPLGIYGVVFILLFVFVVLLEFVWMLNMRKVQTDAQIRSQYNKALGIYAFLWLIGFVIVYLVLMA